MKHEKIHTQKLRIIFFILILSVLTIIKLWLDAVLRIRVESFQSYDDVLFAKLAVAILNGNWLGDYNNLTLVKSPLYPMWLALNYKLGTPLLLMQSTLYFSAGLTLLWQLRKFQFPFWSLIILYVFYLFNPFVETRILRGGLYCPLIVFAISGLISMYINRQNSFARFLVTSFLSGIALSLFWLTREEGIWLLPIVLLLTAYTIHTVILDCRKRASLSVMRVIICFLPFVFLQCSLLIVKSVNQKYYGVSTIVEQKSKSFLSAYGALSRVKHPKWIRYLQVPADVRQSIYSLSPAFSELKPYIDGNKGKKRQRDSWIMDTCQWYPETCPDIAGLWFMWALRDAVESAGYYSSAVDAKNYYLRLADEVNSACSDGQLDCLPERATLIPPARSQYIDLLIKRVSSGANYILSVPVRNYVYDSDGYSKSNEYGLKYFYAFTHNRVLPSPRAKRGSHTELKKHDHMKLSVLRGIQKIFQLLFQALGYLIIPVFIGVGLIRIATKKLSFIFILIIGIFGALIARLFMLSIIDVTLFPAFELWPSYIMPFYPLLIILIFLLSFEVKEGYRLFKSNT